MEHKPQSDNTIEPKLSKYTARRPIQHLLGAGRDKYLARLGFRNLRDLLNYEPVKSARMLAAVARGLVPNLQIAGLVKEEFARNDAAEAIGWPVTALHN